MTLIRPLSLLSILVSILAPLFVSLGAWSALADHEGAAGSTGRSGRVLTPLEAMSPGMAVAYRVAIQEELAAHGYDPGPPDGRPGPSTARAILAYQRDAGLPADGLASKELLDHLKFVLPKVYARQALQETWPSRPSRPWSPPARNVPELSPGPDQEGGPEAPTRLWPPQIDEPRADEPRLDDQGSLSEPAPGGVVTKVQDALKRRGYYDGPVDGSFGSQTGKAIRRFQEDWGMAETGVIDAPLLAVLLPPTATAYDL